MMQKRVRWRSDSTCCECLRMWSVKTALELSPASFPDFVQAHVCRWCGCVRWGDWRRQSVPSPAHSLRLIAQWRSDLDACSDLHRKRTT